MKRVVGGEPLESCDARCGGPPNLPPREWRDADVDPPPVIRLALCGCLMCAAIDAFRRWSVAAELEVTARPYDCDHRWPASAGIK